MAKPIRVKQISTGKTFNSLTEASKKLHHSRHWIISSRDFELLPCEEIDRTALRIPVIEGPEEFNQIPTFPNYAISNKGTIKQLKHNRIKTVTTTKAGQHTVMLFKDSQPHLCIAESLFKLVWGQEEFQPTASRFRDKSKRVEWVNTNLIFSSIKECCSHMHVDYAKFMKAKQGLPIGAVFSITGNKFRLLKD